MPYSPSIDDIPYRKTKIPKALREQVWIQHMGRVFDGHCRIVWCKNTINAFDFQCGHNVPESKGGKTNIDNLIPICARCNNSMGSNFTIDEWNKKFAQTTVPAVESTNCMLRALDRFRYKPS